MMQELFAPQPLPLREHPGVRVCVCVCSGLLAYVQAQAPTKTTLLLMAHIWKTEGAIHESAVIITLIAIILQEPLMAAASPAHPHTPTSPQSTAAGN